MDMSLYNTGNTDVARLERENKRFRACLYAIRMNMDILADVFFALSEHPPNATRAMESFEEINNEPKIALYALSPAAGGIWTTWKRHAIKTGDLGPSYEVYTKGLDSANRERDRTVFETIK